MRINSLVSVSISSVSLYICLSLLHWFFSFLSKYKARGHNFFVCLYNLVVFWLYIKCIIVSLKLNYGKSTIRLRFIFSPCHDTIPTPLHTAMCKHKCTPIQKNLPADLPIFTTFFSLIILHTLTWIILIKPKFTMICGATPCIFHITTISKFFLFTYAR